MRIKLLFYFKLHHTISGGSVFGKSFGNSEELIFFIIWAKDFIKVYAFLHGSGGAEHFFVPSPDYVQVVLGV